MPNTEIARDANMPLVSVLVITFNGGKHVRACLASLLDQDMPRELYEVAVIDNHSTDGTLELIEREFPSVRLIRLDRNYGPNTALSRARPFLKGKYIAYANQDVVAHRRWLAELVETAQSHPRAGVVESNMILPQWKEYRPEQRDAPVETAYVCDLTPLIVQDFRIVPVTPSSPPIPVLSAYCAACIMNPEVLDTLGYWTDEGFFAYFDDIDLGLRLNASGYEVLLAPRSVVFHDTIWLFKWSWRSLRRAYLSTRNMVLVFYKLCYPVEFAKLLVPFVLGKLVRAGQHQRSRLGKVLYGLAAMPLLTVGMVAAIAKMPEYRKRRAQTLSCRVTPSGWVIDSIRKLDWGPDRGVWSPAPVTVESNTLNAG